MGNSGSGCDRLRWRWPESNNHRTGENQDDESLPQSSESPLLRSFILSSSTTSSPLWWQWFAFLLLKDPNIIFTFSWHNNIHSTSWTNLTYVLFIYTYLFCVWDSKIPSDNIQKKLPSFNLKIEKYIPHGPCRTRSNKSLMIKQN